MHDAKSVWAWVISRFALGASRTLAAGGTPSGFAALNGACEAARSCLLCARRLCAGADGNVVLVMNVSPTKSLSLLLADDHTLIGDALTHVLKTAGYQVERVFDGVAAREEISANVERFDVLIADHRQPRLAGVDLVESLRHVGFTGRILVYGPALSRPEETRYRSLQVELVVVPDPESARLLAIMKALHGEK